MRQRIQAVLRRAKFAAAGGAVGGAIGGVVGRNAASTGAGIGALVGATLAEKIGPRDSLLTQVRGDDSDAATE
jgi:outer membrane lipoprotein SlyB